VDVDFLVPILHLTAGNGQLTSFDQGQFLPLVSLVLVLLLELGLVVLTFLFEPPQ